MSMVWACGLTELLLAKLPLIAPLLLLLTAAVFFFCCFFLNRDNVTRPLSTTNGAAIIICSYMSQHKQS